MDNRSQSGQKAWIVRAGEDSRHAEGFASAGAIAIGWNDIPGLDDLRGMEQKQIEKLLREVGRSAGVASVDAREMLDFRDNIQLNDVVVTPDSPAGRSSWATSAASTSIDPMRRSATTGTSAPSPG